MQERSVSWSVPYWCVDLPPFATRQPDEQGFAVNIEAVWDWWYCVVVMGFLVSDNGPHKCACVTLRTYPLRHAHGLIKGAVYSVHWSLSSWFTFPHACTQHSIGKESGRCCVCVFSDTTLRLDLSPRHDQLLFKLYRYRDRQKDRQTDRQTDREVGGGLIWTWSFHR